MKIGRMIPLAIAILALALVSYALLRGKVDAPDSMIGRTPETLSLAHLTPNGPAKATPFEPKGPVIVNFWASWCTPCRAEHPLVQQLAKESGLPIVGIAYRDEPAKAAGYLSEMGNPYADIRLDGIKGVPETYLIGPDGTIISRISGPLTAESAQKIAALARDARTATN
jgi:cytochrome c biogenesis protein CcmG, thiol:disulfide interchange protein DsbE